MAVDPAQPQPSPPSSPENAPNEPTQSQTPEPAALATPSSTSLSENFAAAITFLLPIGRRKTFGPTEAVPNPVSWIVPIGLLIGLIWAGSFRLSWRLYGEIGSLRVLPSLTVVLVECIFTGSFLALGLARTAHVLTGRQPFRVQTDRMIPLSPVGTLVLCLIVMVEFFLILSIDDRPGWWPPPNDWRYHFNFMYPHPIYRPLLLAPIWGRWGILLAATIGQTARDSDAETVALNRAMSPGRLLLHALLPLCLTAIYCSRSRNYLTGVIIGMLVFGITYVVTVAIARRGGGQSRQSLFAAGQIAQLAFLAVYRAFWRLIDG
ncbi:MAG: adenosylcobinamide-GDP ribazoletransferase [Phycisphaerales bacterium]|nr:adenosylcobinamide-GDP ribazoletransferase [Phycisphaerales bacterium]